MENSPNRKRRGALLVHEQLREDILWLRIDPGSVLDEVDLAARFEVSRTPIREALLLLSGEGLVNFQHNRTTIVAPLLLNNTREYFDTLILLSRSMARSAAITSQLHGSTLEVSISKLKAATEAMQHEEALRAHLEILRTLSGATDNRFLKKYFAEVLDAGIRTKLLHYFPNATADELLLGLGATANVVEHVSNGDADAADNAIRSQLLAEADIILRASQPSFGHTMAVEDPSLLFSK